jgi:hypothetical protein
MGVIGTLPRDRAAERLEPLLDDDETRRLVEEIVEVALRASMLESERCNIVTAVRRLGQARGVAGTYDEALNLAATAIAYAAFTLKPSQGFRYKETEDGWRTAVLR